MKMFMLGVATGLAVMLLVVVGLMITGTPYQSMVFKYGRCDGYAVAACPKFVVIYQNEHGSSVGCCPVTFAGRYTIVDNWGGGFGPAWGGGATGIDMLRAYDPDAGMATIFVHGHILRVENEGTKLRVQDRLLRLGQDRIVVIVDEKGYARQADADQTATLLTALPKWFTDNEESTAPIVLGENAAAAGLLQKAIQGVQ